MKALQSVGQIIGEVLKQLDDERCERSWQAVGMKLIKVIVKASSGPRYVVSYRPTLPAHKVSYAKLAESPQADAAVEAGCPSLAGHDHLDDHAYSPKRSRSYGQSHIRSRPKADR
jgi:hypothetical protein